MTFLEILTPLVILSWKLSLYGFHSQVKQVPFPLPLFYSTWHFLFLHYFLTLPWLFFKKQKYPPNFQGPTKTSPPLYSSPPPPRLRLNPVICSFVSEALSVYCITDLHYSLTIHSHTCLSLLNYKSPPELRLSFIHFCTPITSSEATRWGLIKWFVNELEWVKTYWNEALKMA